MSIFSKMTAIADEIRAKTGKSNKLTLDEMASEIAGIETGVELNFSVVGGGTTEPSNPTENMIWVNTDTPITSWEFSATEPNSFREIELSCVSNNQWYLTCSQSLSVGNVLYFEIPASVTNTYEAINIIDPVTGNEYFIRNNDGSACTTWVKGTKICVILSDDTNGLNGYGSTGKTAYIINDNSYGVAKGKVWICVGTSSPVEFNLLKENTAKTYPIFAKQYVDSAWVDKTAKTYQNGKWVDWFIYLLLKNNQYTDLTGGWTTNGFTYGSIGFAGSSASEDGVIINASSGVYCGVCTAKKVNFSKYRKLTFVLSEWGESVGVRFSTSTNVNDSSALVAQYTVSMDDSGYGEIDISDVSGSCYLVIMPSISTLLSEVRVEL